MSEQEEFFIAEAIRHARTLPLQDCIMFLDGMIGSVRDDAAFSALARARNDLKSGDSQLELIAMGQLRLKLDGDGR